MAELGWAIEFDSFEDWHKDGTTTDEDGNLILEDGEKSGSATVIL